MLLVITMQNNNIIFKYENCNIGYSDKVDMAIIHNINENYYMYNFNRIIFNIKDINLFDKNNFNQNYPFSIINDNFISENCWVNNYGKVTVTNQFFIFEDKVKIISDRLYDKKIFKIKIFLVKLWSIYIDWSINCFFM